MKVVLTILAFYLGCLAAVAMGGEPTAEMTQACVRIHCGGSAGSGCLVGKDSQTGLIVTCNHLFDGENAQPIVTFPNGQQFQGVLVAADPINDLAAIAIAAPSADPVPLANYRPEKGERIYSAGFGSTETNRLAINAGVVEFYADRGDNTFPGIHISGSVRPGDSGGPMFNDRGEVAAVLWGGAEGDGVVGTGSARMSAVLAQCPPGRVCQPYRIQQPYQPVVRPAQPLSPLPAKPDAKPCNCDNAALIARIAKLEAEIVRLAGLAVPGQPGPTGQKGDKGDKGEPGAPATVDIAAIVAEVAKQTKPCECNSQDDAATRPGQPVYFDIKPRKR